MSSWDLWLMDAGESKVATIKVIQQLYGFALNEANNFMNKLPGFLKEYNSYEEAKEIAEHIYDFINPQGQVSHATTAIVPHGEIPE